jgi:KDO2-lipid IV(A) lauroyltransferase
MATFRERFTSSGYRAGWSAVKALPKPMADGMFKAAGDYAFIRQGKGAQRLEHNLRRVLGDGITEHELKRTVRAGLRSYSRYWEESFRLPKMTREQIMRTVHPRAKHNLHDNMSTGTGCVSVLPHMANWDLAGAWAVLYGFPFTTVAERLEPAELFDQFVEFREGLGMEVLALTGGEVAPFEVLCDRVASGRLLCLLADRDLTASGVEVEFFGATAKMPAGPALIALRTGAPLMPITLSYDHLGREGLHIRFHDAIPRPETGDQAKDVAIMTQSMADAFAEAIREHPEDWHMMQRLWLQDLEHRR